MNELLKDFTREQLENKLLHITEFIAFKLATEYIELTEPEAKIIRTAEGEEENAQRILEHIVCIYPAWDVLEKVYPSYNIMKDWVSTNHKRTLINPCSCSGCVIDNAEVN